MEPQKSTSASPPSSPLSVLSKSPSPPASPVLADPSKRYPSPTSTMQSGNASPIKQHDAPDEIRVRGDAPPPAKRRRTQPPKEPKERRTEYLDLEEVGDKGEDQLERLLAVLRRKKKIVVIAGAGISVSAGIPDFRSRTGLFTTLRGQHKHKGSGKHLFDASVYRHDSSTSSFHEMVRELAHKTQNAKPTPFHHLLASLAHEGRLMRLYTQNVDCIETSMEPLATKIPLNTKGPWPTTIQLHGGLDWMVCTKCGQLDPFDGSLFDGPEAPPCAKCQVHDEVRTVYGNKRSHGIGRLRPRMVLYNEYHPDDEAIGNVNKADLRRVPDAVIVVGTSLKIPGLRRIVKELCHVTRSRRDGFTTWINVDPEPQGVEFKDCWDLVVRGKCDDVAELVSLPLWNEQEIGDSWKVSGDPDKELRVKQEVEREDIKILLDAKPPPELPRADATETEESKPAAGEAKSKLVAQAQASIPTPSASPKLRTALPDKPTKGRSKQSKLLFADQAGVTLKTTNSSKVKKARRPKQAAQANANLAKAFKATKNVAPASSSTPKQLPSDPESSDLSSPPDVSEYYLGGLPPLRDNVRAVSLAKEARARSSSQTYEAYRPSTPLGQQGNTPVDTISPLSKPRSMENLID